MLVRCKPGHMFGDFTGCLTHSRLPAAAGNQSAYPLVSIPGWGQVLATLLRAKHGDLTCSPPPFLPPGTRGVLVPRAYRSRPGVCIEMVPITCPQRGKASLAVFIVNQELKKRISREKCSVLGPRPGFWPGAPLGAPWGPPRTPKSPMFNPL